MLQVHAFHNSERKMGKYESNRSQFLLSLKQAFIDSVNLQMRTVSQLIYQENMLMLLKKAQCPGPEDCFLTFHVGDNSGATSTWYPISTFKEARGLRKPNLQVQCKDKFICTREF